MQASASEVTSVAQRYVPVDFNVPIKPIVVCNGIVLRQTWNLSGVGNLRGIPQKLE